MASHGGQLCHPMVCESKLPGLERLPRMPLAPRASKRDESCAGQAEEAGSANNLRLGRSGCCAPPAYCVLSLSGRHVLDRIEIEMADHGGTDNGKLPVTYDDFERYGIHRHAIGPAIREVVALGFVEITEAGRAGNSEWRKPNLFRLTYRQTKYEPTNDWDKIKSPEEAEAFAQSARAPLHPRKNKTQWRKAPVFR
jgi:hypothetical protein